MMVVVPPMTAVVILVNDGVPLAPGEEVAVNRESGDESHGQGEGEAPPEEEATGPGLHSPRYREHDQVVHDLHHGNGKGVRSEGERERRSKRDARTKDGH